MTPDQLATALMIGVALCVALRTLLCWADSALDVLNQIFAFGDESPD